MNFTPAIYKMLFDINMACGLLICRYCHNHFAICTFDSSVGRAEDCSGFRLESLGRWFNSGSKENFRDEK